MTPSDAIRSAVAAGHLMPASAQNITAFLEAGLPGWAQSSHRRKLLGEESWGELNDRFYRSLAFGTGGIRGKTIAANPTSGETGKPGEFGTPEHAGVGSNMLNDFTLARAVIGLFRYTRHYLKKKNDGAAPRLVIAHDVRFYSRHFCELSASIWARLGGEAFIFDGPRPTPQLSFTVRHIQAHAGSRSSPRATTRPTTTDSRPISSTAARSSHPTTPESWPR